MAGTVTYVLKDPQATDETPIYLVFWYDQFRIKLSTGESVHPKHWNKKIHKARDTKDNPQGQNLNTRLESHTVNVLNAVREHLQDNGEIVPSKLRAELKAVIKPPVKEEVEPMSLFMAIQEFIDNSNKSARTKLGYGTAFNDLKSYDKTLKAPLTFDSINMDFYEDFVKYLTTKKNLATNSIGSRIKNVKVFMNYANDKGYTQNQGHRHLKFKKIAEEAETIYLSDKEILILYNHDFSSNKKLERVRDLFIVGCYTGLRFSDLSQITPDKITRNGTRLKLKTVKTGEFVEIPLQPMIRAILKKYDNQLPRVISNQKFNEYLKDIGREAEIKETVITSQTKGGMTVESKHKKWELITVHTARRSFATNMFIAGVPAISIMKITGHRTERAFMKYIKITQEQNADLLSKHPYFSKAPLKVVK